MDGFTSIGHIAIRVKDIEKSLEFYSGKLGFGEMFRLHQDGRLWIVFLRITDDQYLELFPDGVGEQSPPRESTGLNHICLTVSDIDLVIGQLTEKRIPLFRPKAFANDRNWQAWIQDPDGNRIELMQMSRDSMQAEAVQRLAKS